MSNTLEEELENIKASLKHLGAIEESLVSDNYLDSHSVSDLESIHDSDRNLKSPNNRDWGFKSPTDLDSSKSFSVERNLIQSNEIIKEKSLLINRLYTCIEELKGEIQELTSSLDYHIQINTEMEKELEFYRYSKEPSENYDVQFLQSEFRLLQEKYEEALSQIRSKDLKNAELSEILGSLKGNAENNSAMMQSYHYSNLEGSSPRAYLEYSPSDDICNEIARELQLESQKDILPRVIHLKEYYSLSKEFRKLYKKLAESMIKKIGRHNVTGLPSCISLWKWVSNELENTQQLLSVAKVKTISEFLEKFKNR